MHRAGSARRRPRPLKSSPSKSVASQPEVEVLPSPRSRSTAMIVPPTTEPEPEKDTPWFSIGVPVDAQRRRVLAVDLRLELLALDLEARGLELLGDVVGRFVIAQASPTLGCRRWRRRCPGTPACARARPQPSRTRRTCRSDSGCGSRTPPAPADGACVAAGTAATVDAASAATTKSRLDMWIPSPIAERSWLHPRGRRPPPIDWPSEKPSRHSGGRRQATHHRQCYRHPWLPIASRRSCSTQALRDLAASSCSCTSGSTDSAVGVTQHLIRNDTRP